MQYDEKLIALTGYHEMLVKDFQQIPDLHFNIQLLISDPPHLAARLRLDCSQRSGLLGLGVNGKKVSFTENVFYEFQASRIHQVWSVIDKAAIDAQL